MVSPLNFNRIAKDKADILAVKQEVTGLVNLSKKEFLSERKNIFSLRYLLIQAVESITDACQHILSKIKGTAMRGICRLHHQSRRKSDYLESSG